MPLAAAPRREEARLVADRAPHPPSVEALLAAVRPRRPAGQGHEALADAARTILDEERRRIREGDAPRALGALADELSDRLRAWASPGLPRTINATGVIIHTNLGRAPWPLEAIEAAAAASRALPLELDRASGRRAARFRLAEEHLVALTGAEDALVTNNNAAAVALAVGLAGRGRGVAVSRGELVEIGGGVRIPEIVRRAGAKLVEVGTTNRTRTDDFAGPLADGSASLILRVHPSNFAQTGFTERPDPRELAELAHRHGALVIDDLGSGALLPTERYGLAHEPTPRERLADGADLVTFSGDKLVGGPQAGFIVGRSTLIARLRKDPLARAMRADKVTLAAVAATLGLYRAGLAEDRVPVWRMIASPPAALHARAAALIVVIGAERAGVVEVASTVGGGSLPGETLPSVGLAVDVRSPDRLLERLRLGDPMVIGRIEADRVILDLRTVAPEDDETLGGALRAALASG
jgi:L-seryl-tRNA(Ser) seleniumtransferase